MQSPGAHVFLVTVLYNSGLSIGSFLACLQAQEFQDWHLIAIDNASSDHAVRQCLDAGDPRISVIRNEKNLGFAKAVNQGLLAAAGEGGEFFIVINNDIQFDSDFLLRFIQARGQLQAKVIAPRIMNSHAPETAWYAGGHLAYDWLFRNVHETRLDDDVTTRQVDFASGCCLGIERSVLQDAGLFDESLFVYWEDTDFCLRLKQLGIRILYVGGISIFHIGGASSGGEFTRAYYKLYDRSYVQLLRKHFGTMHACFSIIRVIKQHVTQKKAIPLLITRIVSMLYGLVSLQIPVRRLQQFRH